MPAASILVKPASSNCDMACGYCFYRELSGRRGQYSLGFMTDEILENLIREAVAYADGSLTLAFQGGEPALCGLDFYRRAVELEHRYGASKPGLRIENTLQTNGIRLDRAWCEFFHENHFLIGLSLDGPKKIHNSARVLADGEPSFEKVMQAASLMEQYGVDFNILTVVTERLAGSAAALYRFYKRNRFPYIQLIPCMDELRRGSERDISGNPYAVLPESYGKFLCEFFDLWYEDFAQWIAGGRQGYVMDVRFFSNLAQMSAGYPPEECGMNGVCNCYFVVEGDGSVYPCDFYCTDEWRLGNVSEGFARLLATERAQEFVAASRWELPECIQCPYFHLCRGGCRRWREPFAQGKPGLNYLCPAYRMFFEHTRDRIQKLGRTIADPCYRL